MKTVRQLADELGVSKQAIRKQVAKLPSGMVSVGSNRTIIIGADGVQIIKSQVSLKGFSVGINQYQPSANQVPTSVNHDIFSSFGENGEQVSTQVDTRVDTVGMVIGMLQQELDGKNVLIGNQFHQLENKDKQIVELTAVIGELTVALENTTASLQVAQALHAGTMHKQLGVNGEVASVEDVPNYSQKESRKKGRLFAWLFRNK